MAATRDGIREGLPEGGTFATRTSTSEPTPHTELQDALEPRHPDALLED